MRNDPSRLRQLLLACACGMVLCLPAALTAHAEDDDDTFEQKVIKNILGGMGVDVGRAGIDYRERSPLVIPPTRDLPPPESAAAAARNPSWPREPERRVAVKSKPNARATINEPGTESILTPEELRRGEAARAGRVTDPSQTTGSIEEANMGRQVSPSQLGNKNSIFSLDGLMGRYNGDTATFTEEPPRTSLTAPPPGYQTPSPAAPYASGQDRNGWKIPTIFDRPVGKD